MKRPATLKENGFRGSFEPQIAKILNHNKAKYKYDVEYESKSFEINIPRTYKPDFVITYPDEDRARKVIEVKGYFTPDDRQKALAFRRDYPEYDYLIIFQRDNKLHKSSSMKYSDWCKKYKIDFAIAEVPIEWLERDT